MTEKVPVVAVGGGVGTGLQWKRLINAWNTALKRENIGVFHTVDFETPEGRKKSRIYESWSTERRNRFNQSLIDAVKYNHLGASIVASVRIDDFNEVAASRKIKPEKSANAFFFCAYMYIEQVCWWADEYFPNQMVSYHFEQGGLHQKGIEGAYDFIANDQTVKNYFKFWRKPRFFAKDGDVGLQVADKLVYEATKHAGHFHDENPPEKHSMILPETGKKVWKTRYASLEWLNSGMDMRLRTYPKKDIEDFF